MKAVVYHDVGDIRLEDVPDPKLKDSTDAIIRITASAICGTDLHFVRGTFPGMKPGTILGHEAVGVIEEVGPDVTNLAPGDRVIIPSTVGCGGCSYCRDGYFAQCDHANPNGALAGTCFFGGPGPTGPVDGLQSEYARIPFANVGPVRLPDEVSDDQAILISDIFPTGYFAAHIAEICSGDVVAVYGCGPVGQFAILSAYLMGAGRVIAVDRHEHRLEIARKLGAETINFQHDDPVDRMRELTRGAGADRVIDAVGIDAECATEGPATPSDDQSKQFSQQRKSAFGDAKSDDATWSPGSAHTQALDWAVQSVAKAGTLSIVGVYPPSLRSFPIGEAMGKNLTINMGNCNHRRYMRELVRLVRSGEVDPLLVLTQHQPLVSAIEAYETFNRRKVGWMKVELTLPNTSGSSNKTDASKSKEMRGQRGKGQRPERDEVQIASEDSFPASDPPGWIPER